MDPELKEFYKEELRKRILAYLEATNPTNKESIESKDKEESK